MKSGADMEQFKPLDPEKLTILMIEDNAVNLKILVRLLVDYGYQLLIADDGELGLQMARERQPHLILLDIVLPKIDGFSLCTMLKNDPLTAHIPIIFMTGVTDLTNKVRGFELGAVDYITKPFQTSEALARIQTHLHIRQLERGLRQEIEMRGRLIDDLDAFAQTVAHDLKGPVSQISGLVDLLLDQETLSEGDQRPYLDAIRRSNVNMSKIIDSLLILARVGQQEEIALEPVEMGQVLLEAQARLQDELTAAAAELTSPGEFPQVRGYFHWLVTIWVNLISNAIKYGGDPPRIEIGAERLSGGFIRFHIRDNGKGLTGIEREMLYAPFTRFHGREIHGHGLGLSIVARIISRLGGEVGAESAPGGGTVFFFTLPEDEGSSQ
jgi:two-component system sensor histidine kinase/response regulator